MTELHYRLGCRDYSDSLALPGFHNVTRIVTSTFTFTKEVVEFVKTKIEIQTPAHCFRADTLTFCCLFEYFYALKLHVSPKVIIDFIRILISEP